MSEDDVLFGYVPPVTWVEECDFEAVQMDRLVGMVVKACAESLFEFPELNARLEGDEIVYLDRCDIGVAVQKGAGSRRPGPFVRSPRRPSKRSRPSSCA